MNESINVSGGYVIQVFRNGKLDEIICADDRQPEDSQESSDSSYET